MTRFADAGAVRIAERDYHDLLMACVATARRRIYASVFLFDARPVRDVRGHALDLAMALAERRRLGADVRVLLTGQVSTVALGVANVATGILLESHGVPHRRVFAAGDGRRTGSHAKFALIDDVAILGSQNWTDDAFNDNFEDAVLLRGSALDPLETEFLRLWPLGKGLPEKGAPAHEAA
jgi:phosphatidylserine/phosphatidylglycerophosphate/cardiolipin synthase-like enzyme